MKTDGYAPRSVFFIILGGMTLLAAGCATIGPESASTRGDENHGAPDRLVVPTEDIDPEPRDDASEIEAAPAPARPHPDAVWRIPSPEPGDARDPLVLPASPSADGLRDPFDRSHPAPASHRSPETPSAPPSPPEPRASVDEVLDPARPIPPPTVELAGEEKRRDELELLDHLARNLVMTPDAADTATTDPTTSNPTTADPSTADPVVPDDIPTGPDRPTDADAVPEDSVPVPAAEHTPDAARRAPPSSVREDSSAERSVEPGTPFEITLPGRGWIYLGGGDDLEFMDRTTDGRDVVFSFRGAVDAPEHPSTLLFESQDLTTGDRARHEERIRVEHAEDENREQSESSRANDQTAGSGGADSERGSGADTASARDGASHEELIDRADELYSAQDYQSAVDLLEEMRTQEVRGDDEIVFRLAQAYEAQWEGRDLRKARDLYQTVVENFPLSPWRRRASERIEHLNRHFFHIR